LLLTADSRPALQWPLAIGLQGRLHTSVPLLQTLKELFYVMNFNDSIRDVPMASFPFSGDFSFGLDDCF
jgi:hypothetical protein